MNAPQRQMRIIEFCFVVFGLLLIYLMIKIPAQSKGSVNPAFELVVTLIALVSVAMGFLAPRFLEQIASRTPQSQPRVTPLKRWTTVNLLSLSFFNACNLFGFVLHSVGGRVQLVEIVFAAGMISLLLWNPGNPPAAEEENAPQS